MDALTFIHSRNPVRVPFFFAIGILLPAVILGTLGIRSYRFENRVMQTEAETRFAASADLIESKISDQFANWITAMRSIASHPSIESLTYAQILPMLMTRHSIQTLPIAQLYIFDTAEHMVAPWPADLSHGVPPAAHEVDWGPIADDIDRLEKLEFVSKDVKGALQGYLSLQSRSLSPTIHAALQKNIAVDYRKLKQTKAAATTYLQLAAQHEQMQDFSGVPTGILGRQRAYALYEQDKSWKKALEIQLDLYEGLILRQWSLTDTQRAALLAEVKGQIARSPALASADSMELKYRWERLQALQSKSEFLWQSGEQFLKQEWPPIIQRIHQLGRLDQGTIIELLPRHLSQVVFAVPIIAPQTGRRIGMLVAITNADPVWKTVDDVIAPPAKKSGVKVDWTHGAVGQANRRSLWKVQLARQVSAIDPPISFQVVEADSSARELVFRRRQWMFGAVIGLSFVVLLFGMGMTYYAVKRETEVANLKSDFVATVSHELRTPLTAISTIGDRLSRGRYESEQERKDFYDLLCQETQRLRTLIEDILDFSKMLAGKKKYRREPLDVVALVQEAIETFEPKADHHGFMIHDELPSTPMPILGDVTAIRQAVLNLLDNAMKYSGDGRTIRVRVQQAKTHALVSVMDQGVGISDADKAKIFEKYYRVERGRQGKTEGGVGLGLSMIKHVVEGHGGTIRVESRVGKGTAFTLSFPLATEVRS